MRRREFLLGAVSARPGAAPAAGGKLERICISSWSFHNLFPATRDRNLPPLSGKPLELLEFPEMIADRYHVHNLEIVAPHFASTKAAYLNRFRLRLRRAHSRLVNIPADLASVSEKGGLSAPDPRERERVISAYSRWVDYARALGARSVRCDPGKINPADLSSTIAAYKELVVYGRTKGIRIIVENHGGVASEHPEQLVTILKASGAGALPDFGNFPNEETRERGLRLLFPLALSVCHAKLNPARFDIARCVRISKEAGYRGAYSIEVGGSADPYDGVQQVLAELKKNL